MDRLTASELRMAGFLAARAFDNDKGDLAHYVLVARSVFESAIASAAAADAATAAEYRIAAFNTAYNIAAATWPGWGPDTQAKVTPELLRIGAAFAQHHLELLSPLELSPRRCANAHWIVGAHRLAANEHTSARAAFATCRDTAEAGGVADTATMARGWLLLIDVLDRKTGAAESLAAVEQQLSAQGDDGKVFAAQYAPALAVFDRR